MKLYTPKITSPSYRQSPPSSVLFLMAFAHKINNTYIELNVPVACRDIFSRYLGKSQLHKNIPKENRLNSFDLPDKVNIALYVTYPDRLSRKLKFLREIESKLGFSETRVTVVETVSDIQYGHLNSGYPSLLPSDKRKVVILTFDQRWLTNQPTLSAYTGIIRCLLRGLYKRSLSYNENLMTIMKDLTGHSDGIQFINLWHKIHNDTTVNELGFDKSTVTFTLTGQFDQVRVNGSLDTYNGLHDMGVRKFMYLARTPFGNGRSLFMKELLKKMNSELNDLNDSILLMSIAA